MTTTEEYARDARLFQRIAFAVACLVLVAGTACAAIFVSASAHANSSSAASSSHLKQAEHNQINANVELENAKIGYQQALSDLAPYIAKWGASSLSLLQEEASFPNADPRIITVAHDFNAALDAANAESSQIDASKTAVAAAGAAVSSAKEKAGRDADKAAGSNISAVVAIAVSLCLFGLAALAYAYSRVVTSRARRRG